MKHSIALPALFLMLGSCAQPVTRPDHPQRVDSTWGKPMEIDPSVPPDGTQLMRILLENQSVPLKGTQCENSTPSMGEDKRSLHHLLAAMLGTGLASTQTLTLVASTCETASVELPDGSTPEEWSSKTIIDAWTCSLTTAGTDEEKERYFSASSIRFIFTKDTWKLFPKRLSCS